MLRIKQIRRGPPPGIKGREGGREGGRGGGGGGGKEEVDVIVEIGAFGKGVGGGPFLLLGCCCCFCCCSIVGEVVDGLGDELKTGEGGREGGREGGKQGKGR
jgi:hypothetical protein